MKTYPAMLVKTYCAAVTGLEATTVTVEVSLTRGVLFHLTGLPDNAVRESHDRIVAALQNNGYKFPVADITVNMAPADLRKEGSAYDLPLAIGLLAASGKVEGSLLGSYMLIGELGLDGRLQPVRGALPIAIKARADKFKGLIVPRQNVREAAVVNNLDVYGMDSITDVVEFLNGGQRFEPTVIDTRAEFYSRQSHFDNDFADVRGQESVKRAPRGGRSRGPQPHHDRPTGQRQVDDGQAAALDTAASVARREPGDDTDTQRGGQAQPRHVAHIAAPLPARPTIQSRPWRSWAEAPARSRAKSRWPTTACSSATSCRSSTAACSK